MEVKLASNRSLPRNIPIEIYQDSWRFAARHERRAISLPTNIESENQSSQVYNLMLTNLKNTLEKAVAQTEAQIRELGSETIKLNLKKLTQALVPEKEKDTSSTDLISSQLNNIDDWEKTYLAQQQNQEKLIPDNQNQVKKNMTTNLTITEQETVGEAILVSVNSENTETNFSEDNQTSEAILVSVNSENTETNFSEVNQTSSEEFEAQNDQKKSHKKLTKAEQAALALEQRNTYLQELSEKLQQARQIRCLSLKQIHKQTFVPLHYLEAIEKGKTEELPEDVYLRGFIFRIGNALGFDGLALAAALPTSDPLEGLMPSWSDSNKNFGFYLHPVHLYLGYTALMASAIGGLSWMSQQPSPGANLIPDTPESSNVATHSEQKNLETKQTPGLKSSIGTKVVGSDIAPPETMI
ncbi:MAG: helix-turn-helix domain-containing protein [Trichodesmium sp.]